MKKKEYNLLKAGFLRTYANVPYPLRSEIIAAIGKETFSWSSAKEEVERDTKNAEKILSLFGQIQADMLRKYPEGIINLVKERLRAIPANVRFSVGGHGDFNKDQLIEEIDKGSEIGRGTIDMQLQFIRNMPKLLNKRQ